MCVKGVDIFPETVIGNANNYPIGFLNDSYGGIPQGANLLRGIVAGGL